MSVSIKSNKAALNHSIINDLAQAHIDRVIADGGVVPSQNKVETMIANALSAKLDPAKIWFYGSPDTGYKEAAGFVTKAYNLFGAAGDMIVVSGNTIVATYGGKLCFEFDNSMLRATTALRSLSTSMMLEFVALNANFRRVARIDETTTFAGTNNQVGSVWSGTGVGYQMFGYSNAGGTDTIYAIYADFNRLTFITRLADRSEFFLDGASVQASGIDVNSAPNNAVRYFKLGGGSAEFAVDKILAYADCLRPQQMRYL